MFSNSEEAKEYHEKTLSLLSKAPEQELIEPFPPIPPVFPESSPLNDICLYKVTRRGIIKRLPHDLEYELLDLIHKDDALGFEAFMIRNPKLKKRNIIFTNKPEKISKHSNFLCLLDSKISYSIFHKNSYYPKSIDANTLWWTLALSIAKGKVAAVENILNLLRTMNKECTFTLFNGRPLISWAMDFNPSKFSENKRKSQLKIIDILLQNNISILDKRDETGNFPYDYAIRNGYSDALLLILGHLTRFTIIPPKNNGALIQEFKKAMDKKQNALVAVLRTIQLHYQSRPDLKGFQEERTLNEDLLSTILKDSKLHSLLFDYMGDVHPFIETVKDLNVDLFSIILSEKKTSSPQ